jgi:hypothetical protein
MGESRFQGWPPFDKPARDPDADACDASEPGESIAKGGTLPPRSSTAPARVPCPLTLVPDGRTEQYAANLGIGPDDLRAELESFVSYWHGRGALMVDWQAKLRAHLREVYWRRQYPAEVTADESWREEPTISEAPAWPRPSLDDLMASGVLRVEGPRRITPEEFRAAYAPANEITQSSEERLGAGAPPPEDASKAGAESRPSGVPSAAPAPVTIDATAALSDIRKALDESAYLRDSGEHGAELWDAVNRALRSMGM